MDEKNGDGAMTSHDKVSEAADYAHRFARILTKMDWSPVDAFADDLCQHWKNGAQVDHRQEKFPPSAPVRDENMKAFAKEVLR